MPRSKIASPTSAVKPTRSFRSRCITWCCARDFRPPTSSEPRSPSCPRIRKKPFQICKRIFRVKSAPSFLGNMSTMLRRRCCKKPAASSSRSDFLSVRMLDKQEAFRVLKRTLNFHPDKLELAKLKYDTFLDYYLPESPIECHRGYLRVDDYYVKVLTLKEPSAQSFPLIFKRLLEVEA